jgi:hypothetical protein
VAQKLRRIVFRIGPQLEAEENFTTEAIMTMFKKVIMPVLAGVLVLGGLTACEKDGPMERAGEKIDRSVERAGDKAERATDR